MEQNSNYFTYSHYEYSFKLPLNKISDKQFWLLIELSGIRSDKIIISLREHLVDGFSKLEACKRNNVALSYFSVSMKKLRRIHNIVAEISDCYINV